MTCSLETGVTCCLCAGSAARGRREDPGLGEQGPASNHLSLGTSRCPPLSQGLPRGRGRAPCVAAPPMIRLTRFGSERGLTAHCKKEGAWKEKEIGSGQPGKEPLKKCTSHPLQIMPPWTLAYVWGPCWPGKALNGVIFGLSLSSLAPL